MPSVADVTAALDAFAPFADACDWDNVGLLMGDPHRKASNWLVALDLTDAVADEALQTKVDGLLLYHPPIFEGIKNLTPNSPGPTSRLYELAREGIALLSTHTAMDCAVGGTNDVLLDLLDCRDRRPLDPVVLRDQQYKLIVFVPAAEVDSLRSALSAVGAGVIGAYSDCSYELHGRGSFRGDETTNPTRGRKQQLEYVDEVRLEMVAPATQVASIVQTLYRCHSYEEPAFDLVPLHSVSGRGVVGLGRVGELPKPTSGKQLLKLLAKKIDCSGSSVVGDLKHKFQRVVAAAGSFGVGSFRDPDALYLTGEFKHHDALQLQRRGVTAIHLGHYESERLTLDTICRALRKRVSGLSIRVARRCRSPFQPARKHL